MISACESLSPSLAIETSFLPLFMLWPDTRPVIICPSPVLRNRSAAGEAEKANTPQYIINPFSCSVVGFCMFDKISALDNVCSFILQDHLRYKPLIVRIWGEGNHWGWAEGKVHFPLLRFSCIVKRHRLYGRDIVGSFLFFVLTTSGHKIGSQLLNLVSGSFALAND